MSSVDHLVANPERVAVLAPMSTLDSQPGILNAIACFLDAGYEVDVFTVRNRYYALPNLGNARVHHLPVAFNSPRDPRLLLTGAYSIWVTWVMRGPYVVVFAGGVRALIAAWASSWWRPQRIINLQLELYVGPNLNVRLVRLFKWIERRAIRSCWLSLIHDENRASMLASDANIDISKIEIVPNAPLGPSRIDASDYLRNELNVPSEMKILLAPGSIGRAFMSEEIVVASQDLSKDWCCVLHSAQPKTFDDPYVRILVEKNIRDRVRFSLSPLPYDKIDQVLGSARIGLALYSESGGANTTEVGLASGKLCEFLKLGIPVIASDYPILRRFIQEHGVGLVIADLSELPLAVQTIDADYRGFRQRAASAFDRELAFEKHFAKVLDRIDDDRRLQLS